MGVDKCGRCHKKDLIGNQIEQWRRAPHSNAYAVLLTERSVELARELGLTQAPHQAPACLSCHSTAHGLEAERLAYPLGFEDGVQCESCHGPGRDYRKKRVMSDVDLARERGLWDAGADSKICTSCHNTRSPTFDPQRYTLPGGGYAGFDFSQAKRRIAHPIPEDVRGRYLEIEREMKQRENQGH